jgi:Na+-transporting NADH:ubiquinone oxidoreductase subunit NqrD
LPISDLFKSRSKIMFLGLIIAGAAVMVSALTMALTIDPSDAMNLYVMESTTLSVGMVMLCMGIILMKNGEEIFGSGITEMEKQRMHDEMHEQVMSEMRLSPKDLEIQRSLQETDDELFK